MSDSECTDLFHYLFDSPKETMQELATNGWENSPLIKVMHPDAEEVFENRLRTHQNINSLFKSVKETAEPTLASIQQELAENPKPVKPYDEFIEIFGSALWCIFSNNHEVINQKGAVYDMGSFRGSGRFIADFINEYYPIDHSLDYIDFYCCDLLLLDQEHAYPLFVHIFNKLKNKELDWKYSFPRMGIVSFNNDEKTANAQDYDPTKAIAEEIEHQKKQKEIDAFQATLDEAYEEEREEAKYQKPPMIIRAYAEVYGCFPDGWVH